MDLCFGDHKLFVMFRPKNSLTTGSPAPSFESSLTLPSGEELTAYLREGLCLVFFFPRAETPGCTAQACSLRDAFAELSEKGIRVLGVSGDSEERQRRFSENRNLPYPLYSDKSGDVVKAFGVPSFLGLVKRQAFLFRDGVLIWKDESASTQKQAQDVLEILDTLEN